jgi:hypothetical protein
MGGLLRPAMEDQWASWTVHPLGVFHCTVPQPCGLGPGGATYLIYVPVCRSDSKYGIVHCVERGGGTFVVSVVMKMV